MDPFLSESAVINKSVGSSAADDKLSPLSPLRENGQPAKNCKQFMIITCINLIPPRPALVLCLPFRRNSTIDPCGTSTMYGRRVAPCVRESAKTLRPLHPERGAICHKLVQLETLRPPIQVSGGARLHGGNQRRAMFETLLRNWRGVGC